MIAPTASPAAVRDVMTPDPVVVSVDCPLTEAAQLLDFYSISGLPVLDWSGFLVGVVSQTDIVRAEATEELSSRWERLAVRDVMTRPALTVPLSTSLEQAAHFMTEHRVHRLVVIDGNEDEPVGIVSSSDLLRAITVGSQDRDPSCTALELCVELS